MIALIKYSRCMQNVVQGKPTEMKEKNNAWHAASNIVFQSS